MSDGARRVQRAPAPHTVSMAQSDRLTQRIERNIAARANGSLLDDLDIERASDVIIQPRPYRLYKASELDQLPPQSWIIDNAIPRAGIVSVIGAKGHKKTFTALDLGCHVATGLEWGGRKVAPGNVVYVYAEGPFGAKARVDAWCECYAQLTELPFNRGELSLWLLPTSIPINHPTEVALLLAEIALLPAPPVLVIIDTLNMNLDGEEDDKGMGDFTKGCLMLRDRLGATIVVVHHKPLSGEDRGRGHSSFDGAVDTRLIVDCDASRVTIECTHQRNAEHGWTVDLEAVPTADSLALRPSSPTDGKLEGRRREILELGHSLGHSTYTSLFTATGLKETQRSSYKKALKWLRDNEFLSLEDARYSCTAKGVLALGLLGTPEGRHG